MAGPKVSIIKRFHCSFKILNTVISCRVRVLMSLCGNYSSGNTHTAAVHSIIKHALVVAGAHNGLLVVETPMIINQGQANTTR